MLKTLRDPIYSIREPRTIESTIAYFTNPSSLFSSSDYFHFDAARTLLYVDGTRTKIVELLEVVVELFQAVAVLVGIVVNSH